MIVGIYAGLLALMQIWLTLRIVKVRRANRISLGDHGNSDIIKASRIHGNFIETVPLGLLLILILEMGLVHHYILHAMGVALIVARVLHFQGLNAENSIGKGRVLGMQILIGVYLVGALLCILKGLPIDVSFLNHRFTP